MYTGRYDEGIRLLESIDSSIHRSIQFHQFAYFCTGLIKLKRSIRRTDWNACASLLQSLKPDSATDPEVSFLVKEARIDYLTSRGLFSDAFNAIEDLASSLREDGAEILQRVTTLLMKANLFAKMGKPERGFSVALRAADLAFKARLMICLWPAVGLLGNILNSLGEFSASSRLLSAALPQSLEYGDQVIIGTLYSHLGDSHIGLAGLDDPSTSSGARARTANMSKAELYIDRARECWKKAEDIEGECEQLMKRAIVAKFRGDEKLAEEWSQNHNRVWEEGRKRIGDGEVVA